MPEKRLPPDSTPTHRGNAAHQVEKGRAPARRYRSAKAPMLPPGAGQAPSDTVPGKPPQRRQRALDAANYRQLYRKYRTLFDFAPAALDILGLAAMRLRARMIGARFRYASRPGQGTQIHLDLPLVRGKEAP